VGEDGDDGVGVLKIIKCRVEKKEQNGYEHCETITDVANQQIETTLHQDITTRVQEATANIHSSCDQHQSMASISKTSLQSFYSRPNVRLMRGGLCHLSALLSPTSSHHHAANETEEAQLAIQEFISILHTLNQILNRLAPSTSNKHKPQTDILFVHLYLSRISHFANINERYKQYFGMHLPPSRSCVGVGSNMLPGGRRVMMDCIVQLGSGEYLRTDKSNRQCNDVSNFVFNAFKNKHHSLRKTLHVQSISTWAPVCIGPYSQANVLRSSLVFLAGMIGLVPQSMTLIQSTCTDSQNKPQDWEVQLYQCWRNAAAVLDGLEDGGGKLADCLGGLVYFSSSALEAVSTTTIDVGSDQLPWHILWRSAKTICNKAIAENGGIDMGSVDGTTLSGLDPNLYDEDGVLYGGYEDEETWREMTGTKTSSTTADNDDSSDIPLLLVCLADLPMNAQAEIELVCASRRAAACLEVCNGVLCTSSAMPTNNEKDCPSNWDMLWDTGYDFPAPQFDNEDITNSVHIHSISRYVGEGCACISTAIADVNVNSSLLFSDMEDILSGMIDAAISSTTSNSHKASQFTIQNVLNVRLYYVAAAVSRNMRNSGSHIQIDVIDDGAMLRTLLHSVLATKAMSSNDSLSMKRENGIKYTLIPASTVVPVMGMHLSIGSTSQRIAGNEPVLAMQVTFVDAIRMETEMWIRHDRLYQS
jgi:enamine deaminase RidA (YjgF/YER057c/UK114 family)